ncbi:MAG: adenylate kinase, partial [Candidatus Cloacimonetes bacterium]|nr:adenylate kinase [Candidatus Cloacimonadota bacterium]
EVARNRMLARRICPKCKTDYNLLFNPPIMKSICNKCGTRLERRKDDNYAAIEMRISEFYRHTSPVIDFFKSKGILHTINTNRTIEEIHRDVVELTKTLS